MTGSTQPATGDNGETDLPSVIVELLCAASGVIPRIAQATEAHHVAVEYTPAQHETLRAGYESLTVAELRRRGSGRGFRPSQLNQLRKAELVELFIDQLGWGGRLLDEGWEERHGAWVAARMSAALGTHEGHL